MRSASSVVLLALSTLAYGVTGFLQGDFLTYWQPFPDDLPFRKSLALVSAALLCLSGTGLFFERTRRASAALLIILFCIYALSYSPRVLAAPTRIGGVWLGIAEQLAVVIGAMTLLLRRDDSSSELNRWDRYAEIGFGACSITFGIAHFESLKATMEMVPAFIPGGAMFWAISTGLVHIGVGLALITARWSVPATRVGAAMYALFVLLVWLPGAVTHPQQWLRWSGAAISLIMMSSLLLVGDRARHLQDKGYQPLKRRRKRPQADPAS